MTEGYFRLHVFCCTNQRPEDHPLGSCAGRGSVELRNYLKDKSKQLGMNDIRINSAGCLTRCSKGPVIVVYPEGIWYKAETKEDIDAILSEHLQNGEPVERLRLQDDE